MIRHRLRAAAILLSTAACASASTTVTPATPTPATATAAATGGRPAAGARPDSAKTPKPKIKAFKDLITDKAKADSGLFVVWTQGDSTFYEIPNAALGRQMLLVSRIARTATNIGYGGEETNESVVR